MKSKKFYKEKEKRELTREQSTKRKKLFFDKRVTSIIECAECGNPITQNEAKRNHGICDDCAEQVK